MIIFSRVLAITRYDTEKIGFVIFLILFMKTGNSSAIDLVDTNSKLNINEINKKISAKIKESLDYRVILDDFYNEDNVITDLKSHIIDNIYKNMLLEKLKLKISTKELLTKKTSELQDLAIFYKIDFNKLISRLHQEIKNSIEIDDWNSMGIAWVIIAYFFELCDVGVDEIC